MVDGLWLLGDWSWTVVECLWNGCGMVAELVWTGVDWCGLVWHGVEWHGMAWNGVDWRGLAWDGLGWRGVMWDSVVDCWEMREGVGGRRTVEYDYRMLLTMSVRDGLCWRRSYDDWEWLVM